jgi:hypothetical protein
MNPVKKIILSCLVGLALAFAFDALFLDLMECPLTDQISLIVIPAACFGYLVYSVGWTRADIAQRIRKIKSVRLSLDSKAISSFLRDNVPGLILALVFWGVYFYLGLRLNSPHLETVDNYFDADNTSWMRRIAFPEGSQMEMRGPHPLAYFIIRPLGWFLNLFTHSPYLSAVLLNSLTGGVCVFLTWLLVRHRSRDRVYAILIAALLGLSTSHLLFGSVIESYIFSAAALIGFFLLLQTQTESLSGAVSLSLLTFGITLTNFAQNLIGFFISRPRWRETIRFAGLTISLGVILSLLHAAWYPSSLLFFLPSSAQGEEEFTFSILKDPAWKAIGRVILLVRTTLLYSVVAPRPYVFMQEVGGTFPRFNFFKISPGEFAYSSYAGIGNVLIIAWALILFAAGVVFFWNLISTRRAGLHLAFAVCLLLNFVLHLNYGYEPFLYSPDWTYALICFVAFGLAPFAKHRWLPAGLLAFLLLLAYNQWLFFRFIFDTISPFLGQGG